MMYFRIKEARIAANMTQRELADKLGIKDATLSGYETGAHDPKSNTLIEIARICHTTTDFLLGLDGGIQEQGQPAEVGELTAQEERFVWLYGQLGDGGQELIDGWLSLSPSSRRVVLAVVRALQREQSPPPVLRD